MAATGLKRRKATRTYQQEFLLLGFQSFNTDSDMPGCEDSRFVMTDNWMKRKADS